MGWQGFVLFSIRWCGLSERLDFIVRSIGRIGRCILVDMQVDGSMEVDDFNNFAGPLKGAPMPRFERKAIGETVSRPDRSKADRFIPNRSAMDIDISRMHMCSDRGDKENLTDSSSEGSGPAPSAYQEALATSLLDRGELSSTDGISSKILSFRNKPPPAKEGYVNSLRVLYSQTVNHSQKPRKRPSRYISQAPEKILDAPDIMDDYYLNLLDWSASNVLAVALAQTVYLWNAGTGAIEQLCQLEEAQDYVSSLSWTQDGSYLAVGTNSCKVELWDVERLRRVRSMQSQSARIGSLAWNGPTLSSGSRDSTIHHHDVRNPQHHYATLSGHQQEVCGLKWDPSGSQLASGGNDNLLCIWDADQTSPRYVLDHHTAAVKALAWCPWQSGLLASGGGTADRCLRFWNSTTGACVNSIDTKSQVCSIIWSRNDKELLTSHGFSQNQLTVWKYPTLVQMAELTGHTSRVLHTALGPDGETVVSGAADETLRFWKVFSPAETKSKRHFAQEIHNNGSGSSIARGVSIR
mmetsp:Transcript_674/g.1390  ORF Transcript_674/g.1390 Transcript_674/m.1390 type:complete len:522 (+) Transcript_674:2708-4273(+)